MKRFRVWLLIPLLLALPLWFVKRERDNSIGYLLPRYAKSADEPFVYAIQEYQNGFSNRETYDQVEIWGTWFFKGDTTMSMDLNVNVDGKVETGKYLYKDRYRNTEPTSQIQLSSAQLKELRQLIASLPNNDAPSRYNQLLIVTFHRKNKRETVIYNRANLPQAVKDIYKITGAPLDELPR